MIRTVHPAVSITPEVWNVAAESTAKRFAITLPPDTTLPQQVTLHALLWSASENPAMHRTANPLAPEHTYPVPKQLGDALYIAGGLTTEYDAANFGAPLSAQHERIGFFAHAESQTSTLEYRPLDTEQDYSRSGYALFQSVSEMVKAGNLSPGMTAYAHSNGCPELLWAAYYDTQKAKEDPTYTRLFKHLILMGPAGIIDLPDPTQFVEHGIKGTASPLLQDLIPAMTDVPTTQKALTPREQLTKFLARAKLYKRNIDAARKNPDWDTKLKLGHMAFETVEFLGQYTPVTKRFLNAFHTFWPQQTLIDPHIAHLEPDTLSLKRVKELAPKASSTAVARAGIENTHITLVLLDEDTMTPPRALLTGEDRLQLAQKTSLSPDEEQDRVWANYRILKSIGDEQKAREAKGAKRLTQKEINASFISEQEYLQSLKEDIELPLIMERAKALFTGANNTIRVRIAKDTHHATHRFHPEELAHASTLDLPSKAKPQ